jgi:hypothetical protein
MLTAYHANYFVDECTIRWVYGVRSAGNTNYPWVQHFIHHLAPTAMTTVHVANN